jgi:hypothetical protein
MVKARDEYRPKVLSSSRHNSIQEVMLHVEGLVVEINEAKVLPLRSSPAELSEHSLYSTHRSRPFPSRSLQCHCLPGGRMHLLLLLLLLLLPPRHHTLHPLPPPNRHPCLCPEASHRRPPFCPCPSAFKEMRDASVQCFRERDAMQVLVLSSASKICSIQTLVIWPGEHSRGRFF